MSPLENIYYAIGELAYAVARADGEVQPEERRRFQDLITEFSTSSGMNDVSRIIFRVLDNKNMYESDTTYEWAMDTIRANSHYLSPELKQKALSLLEKVAQAYPPVTSEEHKLLVRFKKDIEPLKGDPIFYNQK